jgi:hypothetical protein
MSFEKTFPIADVIIPATLIFAQNPKNRLGMKEAGVVEKLKPMLKTCPHVAHEISSILYLLQ